MQSIPFDPALVLGNLVEKEVLDAVLAISNAAVLRCAETQLNTLIHARRKMDMTIEELISLRIDTADVQKASED